MSAEDAEKTTAERKVLDVSTFKREHAVLYRKMVSKMRLDEEEISTLLKLNVRMRSKLSKKNKKNVHYRQTLDTLKAENLNL